MTHPSQNPRAMRFSQQVKRVPPAVANGDDYDPAETVVRKAHPNAIGANPQASRFASQMRTTMRRRAVEPQLEGVPRCLRLLPPDLLDRWAEKRPQLLERLQHELESGHLKDAHETLRELLYDAPRVEHLLNDIFLVEAYRQLPEEAKEAMPATVLKSVMPGEALPAFADFVDNLKQGDGHGCAEAMYELGDIAPAAERLVASKLKKIIPPPPPPPKPEAPELRRSVPTVQAAFTPPGGTRPLQQPDLVVPQVPDNVPEWLFAMGLAQEWQAFMARCAARQWDIAWDAAEQLAMRIAGRNPEHPELPLLAERMASTVAEGLQLEFIPELAGRLAPQDLLPVLASGGTALLMGCNDALAMQDWAEALERLGMMPEEAQLEPLIEVILDAAWQSVPPNVKAQATTADLAALWAPGAANGLRGFVMNLRAGDRRGADEALRSLTLSGTSNTKIVLMRVKLGWQSAAGLPSRPGTGYLHRR